MEMVYIKRCNGFLFLDPIMHFSMKQRCQLCYVARNSIGFLRLAGSDEKARADNDIPSLLQKTSFRLSLPIQSKYVHCGLYSTKYKV